MLAGSVDAATWTWKADRTNKGELARIEVIAARFGTEFRPADQLFLDSIREDAVANTAIRQAALANTMELRIRLSESA